MIDRDKLFDSAFKVSHGDGVFAYFIYRPIVYVLMWAIFARKKINPNKITIVAFVSYLLAGLSLILGFATPENTPKLMGFLTVYIRPIQTYLLEQWFFGLTRSIVFFLLFYNLALILDCLDGSVARYFGISSSTGRLLDSFADAFGHVVILYGLILAVPQYAALIATYFLMYHALSIVHLSYKFEQVVLGVSSKAEVKGIFRIGPLKILVGTLDYFIMSVNLTVVSAFMFPQYIELVLIIINAFWGSLLLGYVILIARGHKVVE